MSSLNQAKCFMMEKSHGLHDIKADMSSSTTISLGFQDPRMSFNDRTYDTCGKRIVILDVKKTK